LEFEPDDNGEEVGVEENLEHNHEEPEQEPDIDEPDMNNDPQLEEEEEEEEESRPANPFRARRQRKARNFFTYDRMGEPRVQRYTLMSIEEDKETQFNSADLC
jgi:hypothetical protein